MKRLKKVILSLLALSFLAGLSVSCGRSKNRLKEWRQIDGQVKVLSTTAQVHSLVKEIGGERVNGIVLIQGDLDPHSYEMVKGDAEKFELADLVFFNGLGLEHGASLSTKLEKMPNALSVGGAIFKKNSDRILKQDGVLDPHIWMDISLWKEGIAPIAEALSEKDPEGASYYAERGELLSKKMDLAHQCIYEMLQNIPKEKRYLVTSHDAFHYFTKSYLADPGEINWDERFAAPEGLAPEGQLNPKDIQKIIEFLQVKKIHVLFPESNVSKDSVRKIASAGKELGLEIQVCSEPLYGDAMSNLTYLEMMQKNAETIKKYLCNTQ